MKSLSYALQKIFTSSSSFRFHYLPFVVTLIAVNVLSSYKYPYSLTLLDFVGNGPPTFTLRSKVLRPLVALSQKVLFPFSLLGVRVKHRYLIGQTESTPVTKLNGTFVSLSSWPSYIDPSKFYINTCHERTYSSPQVLLSPCLDHAQPHPMSLLRAVDWLVCLGEGEEAIVHCKGGHGRSAAVVLAAMIAKEHCEGDVGVDNARSKCARTLRGLRSVRKKLGEQENIKDFCSLVQETWIRGGGWKRNDGGKGGVEGWESRWGEPFFGQSL